MKKRRRLVKGIRKKRFIQEAVLLIFVAVIAFSLVTKQVFAAVAVVSPSNMQGWAFVVSSPDGIGTFVTGPATPPSGIGSARLFSGVNGNTSIAFHNVSFSNIKLKDVTKLEYSTYKQTTSIQYPKLSLFVDTGNPNFGVERLNFSPESQTKPDLLHNTTAVPDLWQTWDALNGFWSASTSGCNGTIAEYLTCLGQFGDVTNVAIANPSDGLGGIRLQVGAASSLDVLDGNVDNFTIGVNNVDMIYDFEPDVVTPTSSPSPSPVPGVSPSPTPTPTVTPIATPSPGVSPIPTPTPTSSPSPSLSPSPGVSPSPRTRPSVRPTPTPRETEKPDPRNRPSPTLRPSPTPRPVSGPCFDVTGDGVVRIADAYAVYNHIGNVGTNLRWDVDHNGIVTLRDVLLVLQHMGQKCG